MEEKGEGKKCNTTWLGGAKQSEGGDVEVYAAPRAQSGSCAPEKFRGTSNLKTHLGVKKK